MGSRNYNSVIIIFNPNSTGSSKENAIKVKEHILKQSSNSLSVELIKTQHAGHSEELAKEYAESAKPLLLVSSSGDGGYHELINGVAMSNSKASNIVVSLIPSGNANDHHNAMKSDDYIKNIVDKNVRTMDLIKVTATIDGRPWSRYAHSYVGIGVSAHIGRRLTAADLNAFTEKIIVIKGLLGFRYVHVMTEHGPKKYSSLVFSNIDRMSKVLKLSDNSKINDGKIEVNEIHYRSALSTIISLGKMLFKDISEQHSITDATFTTTAPLPIQIDGEDYIIDKDSEVDITVSKRALKFVM